MMTSKLHVDPAYVARASGDDFANAFARIENMFFINAVSARLVCLFHDVVWRSNIM